MGKLTADFVAINKCGSDFRSRTFTQYEARAKRSHAQNKQCHNDNHPAVSLPMFRVVARTDYRCSAKIFPATKIFPPPVTLPSVLSAVCIAQN